MKHPQGFGILFALFLLVAQTFGAAAQGLPPREAEAGKLYRGYDFDGAAAIYSELLKGTADSLARASLMEKALLCENGKSLLQFANEPQVVNRLVLTGCAGLKKPQTEEQKKRSEEYQKKKKSLMGLTKLPLVGGLAQKSLKALQEKYGSADYNALDDEMKKTFVKVISEDLRPLLPKIQASTLLIWGEKDQDTPLWMGQAMEQEIKDAGLVIFENDDHFAYLRQWPRFVTVVRAFLT